MLISVSYKAKKQLLLVIAAIICFSFFGFSSIEVFASSEVFDVQSSFQEILNVAIAHPVSMEPKPVENLTDNLRVGLCYDETAKTTATVSNGIGMYISTPEESYILNGLYVLRAEGKNIVVYPNSCDATPILSTNSTVFVSPLASGDTVTFNNKSYRGKILFNVNNSGKLTVINELDVDDYLRGVLPHEVSPSWNIEALKAAAVASRTFALKSSTHNEFDVCTTTHCQVYNGAEREHANTDKAIEETQNLVLMYNNKLALTTYHSSSGLCTESSSNVWGGDQASYPYLISVFTPYEDYRNVPSGKWETIVTKSSMYSLLKESFPSLSDVFDISVERLQTGRAQKITIADTKGQSFNITGLSKTRSFFNSFVKSSNFGIASTYIPSDSPSNISVITANGTHNLENDEEYTYLSADGEECCAGFEEVYVFDGQGYGHGVGMSQYGAMCMANEGFTYDEILSTYYPGTYLGILQKQ